MKNFFFAISFFVIFIFITSCTKEEEIAPQTELSDFQLEVIDYFKEVALGFENGGVSEITRKWRSQMRIFIDGSASAENITKVEQTVENINELASDGFSIEIVGNQSTSNCYLFFGTAREFEQLFPETSIGSNFGNFYVWWQSNNINRARLFVDTDRANSEQQKSLILEEITQALGIGKDSPRYSNSIFYETSNDGGFATEYAEIDKEVIRLLYHPNMSVGLNAQQVDIRLRSILREE